jgi:hypothetical protein
VLDENGNMVSKGYDSDEDDPMFKEMTSGMDDDDKAAYRLRILEKDVKFQPNNPIVTREVDVGSLGFLALDSFFPTTAPIPAHLESRVPRGMGSTE